MTDYHVVQDDLIPTLEMTLSDSVGAVDLDTATSVTVYVDFDTGVKAYSMTKEADQSGAGKGKISYEFVADDIPDAGDFRMRTVVIWPTNKPQTFPNEGYDRFKVTQAFSA